MNYNNFISERDYSLSSSIYNNELIDGEQDNICYLETKYGKDNLHNIIKTNRSYKNRYSNILKLCNKCIDNNPHTYLDNGLNCLTCLNHYKYLSKIEEKYADLIDRYIIELESLKKILDDKNEITEIKTDLKNLYLIKNKANKKSLNYLIIYKKKICSTNKILECYALNDNVNNLIHKLNISNIEVVYTCIDFLDKDVTEILELLKEYKLTYNSQLFIKIKEIEDINKSI
jgi:hypothetical protein